MDIKRCIDLIENFEEKAENQFRTNCLAIDAIKS